MPVDCGIPCQFHNDLLRSGVQVAFSREHLERVVTKRTDLSEQAKVDMIVASIACKYHCTPPTYPTHPTACLAYNLSEELLAIRINCCDGD